MVRPKVPTGRKCPKGHEMQRVKEYTCPKCYTQGCIRCDNCSMSLRYVAHGSQGVVQAPFTHCDVCHYDLCMVCFNANPELFERLQNERHDVVMGTYGEIFV